VIRSARRGARPPALLALLAGAAVSLSAALLYAGFARDDSLAGVVPPATPVIHVGQGIPTSFGAMAVERVERQPVGRPGGGTRLDVLVALINLRAEAMPLASARVAVRGADGRLLAGAPSAGSAAIVGPRGTVRVTFSFILPAVSHALQVELADGTMASPAVVELGAPTGIPILKELDAPSHSH
jgi:hypothetical protein